MAARVRHIPVPDLLTKPHSFVAPQTIKPYHQLPVVLREYSKTVSAILTIEVNAQAKNRGYLLWNTPIGGKTPCFSTLLSEATPPPIPATEASDDCSSVTSQANFDGLPSSNTKPTSAVVNVAYAMQFPVQPSGGSGLNNGAKAGIGVGVGAVALSFVMLLIYLIWKSRQKRKDRAVIGSLKGSGLDSSVAGSTPHTSHVYPSPSSIDSVYDAYDRRRSAPPPGILSQSYFPPQSSQHDLVQAPPRQRISPSASPPSQYPGYLPHGARSSPRPAMAGGVPPREMSASSVPERHELQDAQYMNPCGSTPQPRWGQPTRPLVPYLGT
ncbi:MAG: hypothetical protein M1833_005569 [Piccolia ochrophora]|nr:MAG: hypothetical protein M1833_005569 [Piccolia ochrophora]